MTTWYIIRCMSQRERWLSNELHVSLGLECYVPIERNVVTLRKKCIERLRPLIPGYVFVCCIDSIPWSDVAEMRHVMGWLEIDGMPATVTDAEVERIREMVRQHNRSLEDTMTFRVGDRVRAKDGPFASMEVLLRSVRGTQATIEVHMLGSTREATITTDHLERVV